MSTMVNTREMPPAETAGLLLPPHDFTPLWMTRIPPRNSSPQATTGVVPRADAPLDLGHVKGAEEHPTASPTSARPVKKSTRGTSSPQARSVREPGSRILRA